MLATDAFQRTMGWPAGAHVIFRVNLEESSLRAIRQNRIEVFMLEARSGQSSQRQSWKTETTSAACVLFLYDGIHCRPRFREGV